jgi:hypothetical protein
MTGDRDSPIAKDFTNAILIARHRPGKSASSLWQGPQAMYMIGQDDPGIDAERGAGPHPADRAAQQVYFGHQQIRTPVEQVHRKEEGPARDQVAAIIRHTGMMPELPGWRKALRFSALRSQRNTQATIVIGKTISRPNSILGYDDRVTENRFQYPDSDAALDYHSPKAATVACASPNTDTFPDDDR